MDGLCVGVTVGRRRLDLAVLGATRKMCRASFPSTHIGWAAIRGFLANDRTPVRIAVAGIAALGFALAVGNGAGRTVIIMSSATAKPALSAVELALYAKRHL